MSTVMTIRIAPHKLAKIDRRAAERGQGRSHYVRFLIERDLQERPRSSRRVFASEDLVGCVNTGVRDNDSATLRKIIRCRVHEKNR